MMNPPLLNDAAGRNTTPAIGAQRGIALITSVMLLVVITLLALSMFKTFGVQEKLAGNTLEKQRSFQAAQSALQYGEWWLSKGSNVTTGVACSAGAAVDGNTVGNIKVCSSASALTNPGTLPWTDRVTPYTYVPPGMDAAGGGGLTTTGTTNDIVYAAKPLFYISYLGLGPDKSLLFTVTGAGYGGSGTNSASVVQSTYAVTSKSSPLDGL